MSAISSRLDHKLIASLINSLTSCQMYLMLVMPFKFLCTAFESCRSNWRCLGTSAVRTVFDKVNTVFKYSYALSSIKLVAYSLKHIIKYEKMVKWIIKLKKKKYFSLLRNEGFSPCVLVSNGTNFSSMIAKLRTNYTFTD